MIGNCDDGLESPSTSLGIVKKARTLGNRAMVNCANVGI